MSNILCGTASAQKANINKSFLSSDIADLINVRSLGDSFTKRTD